jgi:Trypsin-co-occurring domain 1
MLGGLSIRSGGVGVADFLEVVLDDGSVAVFQTAEADLVAQHSGEAVVERYEAATDALASMAEATKRVSRSFIKAISPDEVQLEIGIGLSGQVGWFFAKSEIDATLKLTLTWKPDDESDANLADSL